MKTSSDTLKLDASHLPPGADLVPPLSKSDAHRALTLAHLLGVDPATILPADPARWPIDVQVMVRGLAALHSGSREVAIDCHEGGAPYRILLGQAAVTPGCRAVFTGTPRLGERPHGALVKALQAGLGAAGLQLEEGSPWPVAVEGTAGTTDAAFEIDARESSQFASSLLLAMAALSLRHGRRTRLRFVGEPASRGYLDMTLAWLARAGFTCEEEPAEGLLTLSAPTSARPPADLRVPGDWSSLAYLLLIAWRTGSAVADVDLTALHPDRAIVRLLAEAGLEVRPEGPHRVTVSGTPHSGICVSGKECPDLLPTAAALACALPGPTTLHDVSILRLKESDRLAGILRLVEAGGARAHLDGETLTIHPGKIPPELTLGSAGDHRLAMSAAVLAVLGRSRLSLEGAACVDKSFPAFWEQLTHAGFLVRPPPNHR